MTIPVGYGQATFLFGGNGAPLGAATTLGFQQTGTTDPDADAFDLHQAMRDLVAAVCSDEIRLERTDVKWGPDATGPSGSFSQNQTGGRTGGVAPPNVSLLVRKGTALGGREGRGRMFIPGPSEEDLSAGGFVESALVTAATAALGTFFAALIAADLPPYLLHDSGTPPTAITTLDLDGRAATQRRRLRR
jgi:hypothetical protein